MATGDLSLLRPELRIDPLLMTQEQGGLTPEQQEQVRQVALRTLITFRDNGSVAAPPPSGEDFHTIVEFLAGGLPSEEYVPMMQEEMALTDDFRSAHWKKDDVAPSRDFRVAIVGSGMSGIAAAYRLEQAGVPYVVLEKNDDVGGTWLENEYPGCRVDIPNHYYSYSFAQRDDWPYFYSPQQELHRYFGECVDEFGIRENIRTGTEVTSMSWDEVAGVWTLELAGVDGGESTLTAHAVISAVGQLNRPSLPTIDGRESFAGATFHSAEWDHRIDLAGKRVGVIGTGCTASQFIRSSRSRSTSSRSSSAPRTGCSRFRTTTRRFPTGSSTCSATCRTTGSCTGSGSSGAARSRCVRSPR
jgi:4-hydroxyacetophenone monooxygenase